MHFNYKSLKPYDFISLDLKEWGGIFDCIVVSNKNQYLSVLFTEPYQESNEMFFSFPKVIAGYPNLNGFYYKEKEDAIFLLGKQEPIILKMIDKVFDE